MDRRTFLAGLAALGACATTSNAKPLRGKSLGIQLYALGPEAQNDLDATFAELARIGYKSVEVFSGRHTGPEFRAALDRAGLTAPSIHGAANADMSSAIEFAHAVGARTVVAPMFPFLRAMPTPQPGQGNGNPAALLAHSYTLDDWKRACDLLNSAGTQCKAAGLKFGYHNHNVEFAPLGDGIAFDAIAANTDPALVQFEVDVGWVAAAGADIPAFLNRHRGRVKQMHVKDLKATTQPNFEFRMDPTEVGSGMIDWPLVLNTAIAGGVEEFYVEQEPPFAQHPPLEAARISFQYLNTLK